MTIELRQLRYFAAVAETCHFGQAAERLHLAQPGLSQAIRQLESELGATLFTRTTRHVALTQAGEFLYAQARRLLDGADAAVRGVRSIADGRHGLVRLGLTGTAVVSHLPHLARTIKRELPEVALEIHADLLTPAQCERLRDRTLDLGILRPPAVGEEIAVQTLDIEPLVLALPADHRLAAEPVIALADLRNEPFIGFADKDSIVNDVVLQRCRDAGFVPRREHDAPGTSVLLALVAAGLGVALVPGAVRALPLAGVKFRDVVDAGTIELALAWATAAETPVTAAVRTLILAEFHPANAALPTTASRKT